MTPTLQVQGAPEGVQGVLEEAGYLVYAPTLPYHEPDTQWTPNQGELRAQDYVDYLKVVSHPRFMQLFSYRNVPFGSRCMSRVSHMTSLIFGTIFTVTMDCAYSTGSAGNSWLTG